MKAGNAVRNEESMIRYPSLQALSGRTQFRILRMVLIASDGLMLILALVLAYQLRFELRIGLSIEIVPETGFYTTATVVLLSLWLALFAIFKLYDFRYLLSGTDEYTRIFDACSAGVLTVVTVSFLLPELIISRGWITFSWLLSILFVSGVRFGLRHVVYWLRGRGYYAVPAIIVGVNDEANALAMQLKSWRASGLRVMGFVECGDAESQTGPTALPVLGTLSQLPALVERYGVQELIIATSAVTSDRMIELFRIYGVHESVNLRLSSGLFDIFTTGLYIKEFGYVPLISVEKVRLHSFDSFLKGCLDYCGAIFGLIVLAPLLALIAMAIKLDSPGPVIYRRVVLGRGGKVFPAYKFRSMYVNGHELLTPTQWTELQTHHKLKEDPRITRVGQFIRKYSLDELPQLVNVLRGQMGLIGPRIITPAEQEMYGKWDMNLLTVKPGLSGLWQVSGRSDVSYEERVVLDMQYIRNYSIWVDIELIFRTIAVVISGKGAY